MQTLCAYWAPTAPPSPELASYQTNPFQSASAVGRLTLGSRVVFSDDRACVLRSAARSWWRSELTQFHYTSHQACACPFLCQTTPLVFQQDNAPAHRAQVTQAFLRRNNIPTIQWPAMSADLNPIEHLWSYLKNRINNLQNRPFSVAALRREIGRAWNRVPQAYLARPRNSMPNRVNLTINLAGGHIRY